MAPRNTFGLSSSVTAAANETASKNAASPTSRLLPTQKYAITIAAGATKQTPILSTSRDRTFSEKRPSAITGTT